MEQTKQRILSVIDATQERVRKGSNAAGCFAALRSEIEMLPTITSQWVSVEERLPEDDSYFYLVADARLDPLGVDCAEYTCETKLFSRGGKILHPTHWCAIPQLNPEKRRKMINDDQITALAREYGMDSVDPYGFSKNTYEDFVGEYADAAVDVLRWLSNRFCLVEKSKVEDEYEKAKMDLVSKYHQGSMVVLQVLFPEIAKEVEG